MVEDGGKEDEGDEEDGGLAESLHSACLSPTVPAAGVESAAAPGAAVFSAAVVMATALPSFFVLADAWQ